MNNTADIMPNNMAALEQLLTDVRDRAGIDPAIADVMSEAVKICRTRYGVRAGLDLQHQGAFHAIREGRLDDATRFIEVAIGIADRNL
jgi:hypothetical protein